MSEKVSKAKFKIKIPHVYVVIFVLLIIAAILTYIVPAGQFSYIEDPGSGRQVVDPSSFTYIEKNPTDIVTFARAIPAGMEASVNVIMMVVLIIASFEIVNATGALNAGIFALINKLKGQENIVIIAMTLLFSVIGGFLGWAEGMLMFIPLTISITRAMGYDSLLGVGVVLLGGGAGFTAGPLNVYTVGVAQGIAGLPLFSGLWYRMVAWVIFTAIAVFFIQRYANKIKKNPEKSLLHGQSTEIDEVNENEIPEFTGSKKVIVALIILGFTIIAYGTAKWGWYLKEISGMFILLGVIVGIIGRLSTDQMSESFARGAKIIIPSALVIGMARGILFIMEEAKILDTIINSLAGGLDAFPNVLSVALISVISIIFDFFVTSASSKAAILMPILMPLGDILEIPRQVIAIAYQFGDGFPNYFFPTSGIVMGALAMGGNIPWEIWAKWTIKVMAAWIAAAIALVMIGQIIQLGPF